MSFLDRLKRVASTREGEPEPRVSTLPDPGDEPLADLPLTPETRRIGEEEKAHIAQALEALATEGVDVDDLASISAGLDRALASWLTDRSGDHDAIVQRYAVAIGEHLHRHTDLAWEVVTDAFGTDLAVAAGDFVVVPANLVAVRWMRREQGWVPSVVGHLVTVRSW
ncbi:DUF3806 domain-containing protein [Ornithinimicrobium pratense]|uniref:DUF3806 domain-containing protein n=1 Tax=Ornithinimicrobium pratense TaxID=2593973 RepID=A0A5J6V167_9MICO|nr:DUF3806 domain-containing protein [Ornithinimicrobium pratense]QFG67450.1 DUF3806 domain-containing protein [Ornithinimicrobium pratense]